MSPYEGFLPSDLLCSLFLLRVIIPRDRVVILQFGCRWMYPEELRMQPTAILT